MRVTRKQLVEIVSRLLGEDSSKGWKCPRCGTVNHHHMEKGDKCSGCQLEYDKKFQDKAWKLVSKKNESNISEQASNNTEDCPTATVDISVNTANRDRARKLDWIMYGPLNVEFPGDYWKKIAKKWKTSPEAAKKSNCGNCVAFDRSPKMVDQCIPAITTEPVADEFGVLGYCWMHHFKCHSARTCNTWAAGGPIKTDGASKEWLERNRESALQKSPIDKKIYKDDSN
jgi:phage FluMu protein Com